MSTASVTREQARKTTMASCPFCQRIEAGEFDYEDDYSVAFQPLNPVTPGHFLAVPRVHVTHALWAPEAAGHVMRFAADLADQMGLDACNFITSAGRAASQSVMHLYVHVVPRRAGDGLLLPWTFQQHGGTLILRSALADAIAYRTAVSYEACEDCTEESRCVLHEEDRERARSYAALLDELGGVK